MSEAESTTETTEPIAETPTDTRPGYSPYKLGWGIGTMLVVASILLFLAFISIWANRQIFNGDQWTKTSTQVIEQPAVQSVLANYLVDQLFTNVNVEQQLQNELPPDLKALASPAAGALRSLALSGTKKALALPVVESAWSGANSVAHQALISTLEGGKGNVSTQNGEVSVNARDILIQVADKVGVGQKLVTKVPATAGTFVIWKSNNLAAAQDAYKVFKDFLWIFTLLAIALYVLAIVLAKGRRRRAVIWMGSSFVVVALLVLIAISLGRSPTVGSLAQSASVEPAVTDVYNIATQLLKNMAQSLLFTGILVLLATLLAGPYKWAVETRRFLAPYLRDYLPLATGIVILAFLILLWWAPVHGFRTTVGLLLNTVLAIAGFVALVRITRHEFPDAEPAGFGSMGEWFSGQWGNVAERTRSVDLPKFGGGTTVTTEVSSRPVEDADTQKLDTADAIAADDKLDDVAKLERLQKLHKDGALTDAEFAAMKKQILGE